MLSFVIKLVTQGHEWVLRTTTKHMQCMQLTNKNKKQKKTNKHGS
jgi:hypothetical protein